MKRTLFVLILAVLLCLSACGAPAQENPGTTQPKPTDTSAADTKPTDTQATEPTVFEPQPGYFPIPAEPAEFAFSNGVAGWSCIMDVNTDGTFSGSYRDNELGIVGDTYPNGTVYVCEFSGVFLDVEKVNSYTYKVSMTDLDTHYPVGQEWIEDGVRYVADAPCGLVDPSTKAACEEFIVYLPHTPVSELPEEFLNWWPYKDQGKDTLSCYGLLNVATNDGFFHFPEA